MTTSPIQVLIVDDEPAHAEAVRRALSGAETQMEVQVASSLREFREAVAVHKPDLVLLDFLLPDGRADTALISPPESAPFPMVVMTSHGDEQVAVTTIQRGALDYVVKSPAAFADMPRTVERTLRAWRTLQESRQAQEALRDNERVLRMALEVGRIGAFEADLATGRVTCSSTVAEMWGLPAGFIGGFEAYFWEHVHPDDVDGVRRFYQGILQQNQEQEIEFRVVHPDGTRRWLRWRGRVIRDEAGNGLRVVGVNLDITEQKRLEAEREAALTKYRTLFDTIPLGITVTDRQGRITESNRVAEQLLGLSVREQQQRSVGGSEWNIVRPDGTPMPADEFASIRALREQRTVRDVEMGLVKSPTRTTWLTVTAAPVELPDAGVVIAYSDIGARKQTEEALRASEARYRGTLESMMEGVQIIGFDWRYRFVNSACAKQGRGTVDALLGRTMMEAYPGIETTPLFRRLQQCMDERTAIEFENEFPFADGSTGWFDLLIQPVSEGILILSLDITDRKRAEARAARDKLRTEFLLELHQRTPHLSDRELFDQVLEHAVQLTDSAIGFFHQVSEDQRTIILTAWNQAALQSCQATYDAHSPLNEAGNWVDCVRQQRPVVYNDYANSPNQQGLPAGHAPLHRFMSIPVLQEGKVRIIFGVGNKAADYTDEDVEQLRVVANELHKIMAQRAAQNQLRRSEERFRQLVETTSDSIWEADATGRYTYVSPKIKELVGYEPEEMVGRTPFEFMAVAEAQRRSAVFGEFVAQRAPFSNIESAVLHRDGREIHLETSGAPVVGDHGELLGYRGIDRDISERRRLEAQLRQAQKLEAIGQLAGGVAHDFNNILFAIMMQLGLLEMNPHLDEDASQAVQELNAQAERAAALTRQLLMFSRRSVLEAKPLDLNEVVSNLLKMLGRLIGEHIRLVFDAQPGHLPSVNGDAGMLEQVLLNLVVNARDAMPKGGRITITTLVDVLGPAELALNASRQPGRFVCLAVADTGVGMSEETLKHIFEPFFTTKEPGKGTGLGLATVHGIVAQHKGWVEVASAPGQGTVFRVFLPAMNETVAPIVEDVSRGPLLRGQETILLVEDEAQVRQGIARTLRTLGYRIYEAENGQQALRVWQDHGSEVDLLFTDMVMPEGLTGLELAEQLRALKPGLRVIISSGYSADIVRVGGITQAGICYLPKPYQTQTLTEAIRACLERGRRSP